MMESDLPLGSCNSTGHLSTIGYHSLPGRMHHSASTPAGVDGAGGGSRTPPATPKKGGKMLAVRVQMLDDTISMFQVQSKALGRVLFDQVCRQLHLLEADYFGLEYQDANGTRYWLDVEKPMCRQLGLSMLEPALRFCVKFYTPDPARLEEEFTRYLFCLQVKRDLAHGCIQCNENTAALMASYIVQAECGDFVPEDYPDHTYLSGYKFFPGQDSESERRIRENHKKHIGQSPAEADLNLLETARRCELYGIKMHPAKDHDSVPLNLAVAHMGIVVFQNFTKINTFSWAKIRKISFKRKKFLIKLHPEGYGAYRDVVEFFFEGRNECKNFWKKCVENHGFFRCTSVPRLPRHKTRVISRGSSFRYSGKTQKQIVEFVRDNYVKRQTFQRSGSFRTSRSAAGSRGSVAPPLNASLSAHPLLPLPPGSDAISLEWDKQPHYLEASLMMKGYTAEEARAAALRSQTRRTSEGATRPPLAATAYATTRDKLSKLYCSQIVVPELVTRAEVNHHPTEDSPPPHRMMTPLDSPENTWSQAISSVASGRGRAPTPPPRAARPDDVSPEDTENTVSSASLCMSPSSERTSDREHSRATDEPLCTSTPFASRVPPNGYDVRDGKEHDDVINGRAGGDVIKTSDGTVNRKPSDVVNGKSSDNVPSGKTRADVINGNVNVNIVSESTYSMDVLSGGESDAGDTLSRRNNNNNSISSNLTNTLREGTIEIPKRRGADLSYFVAKELLMTERTYKRDLELVTVTWSRRVSELAGSGGGEAAAALARACLALEPLALACGAALARLERALAATAAHHDAQDNEEPEYKKIADYLHEYLANTADAYAEYTEHAGPTVGLVESVRRRHAAARAESAAFEAQSPLPLAALLLRPLHRLLHYEAIAEELCYCGGGEDAVLALAIARRGADAARRQLPHAHNHCALCQLQRDITGYDKLLVPDREFIRLGCVYKHSTKGLQQRMLFLFTDLLLVTSRAGGGQFRAHAALATRTLAVSKSELPHTLELQGEDTHLLISASNEQEYLGWLRALETAAAEAERMQPPCLDLAPAADTGYEIETSLYETENGLKRIAIRDHSTARACFIKEASNATAGGALAHVCWHRAASLPSELLQLALQTQLSGYLLRKFKKSPGWQKLWVVFAMFTLYFYKSWQDDAPLASLPLLGYSVAAPSAADGIDKDFVFKLQFKNHVYFFRADSIYTYNRWVEVLKTPMVHYDHN